MHGVKHESNFYLFQMAFLLTQHDLLKSQSLFPLFEISTVYYIFLCILVIYDLSIPFSYLFLYLFATSLY